LDAPAYNCISDVQGYNYIPDVPSYNYIPDVTVSNYIPDVTGYNYIPAVSVIITFHIPKCRDLDGQGSGIADARVAECLGQ
jgi:hypothetical protein